ncbi:hypothetical protein [Bradyrhizobium sp. 187]|nr:hypothetical protein [Bradyrhizobium sp. 187]UPJ71345.1 hypothetical protein IVB19_27515 [Bradyrhizobium sp. 187]
MSVFFRRLTIIASTQFHVRGDAGTQGWQDRRELHDMFALVLLPKLRHFG